LEEELEMLREKNNDLKNLNDDILVEKNSLENFFKIQIKLLMEEKKSLDHLLKTDQEKQDQFGTLYEQIK
jgi:hypothetical protein